MHLQDMLIMFIFRIPAGGCRDRKVADSGAHVHLKNGNKLNTMKNEGGRDPQSKEVEIVTAETGSETMTRDAEWYEILWNILWDHVSWKRFDIWECHLTSCVPRPDVSEFHQESPEKAGVSRKCQGNCGKTNSEHWNVLNLIVLYLRFVALLGASCSPMSQIFASDEFLPLFKP